MKHPDEDQLLNFGLHLLNVTESKELENHLLICKNCQDRLQKINSDIEVISGVELKIERSSFTMPKVKAYPFKSIMKMAAVLVIGFMVGYTTSFYLRPPQVNVIPHRLNVKSEPASIDRFTPCESTEIGIDADLICEWIRSDSLNENI